jgi:hypothetical protein
MALIIWCALFVWCMCVCLFFSVLVLDMFDYVFVENGLEAFHDGELIHRQDIKKYLGEENIKRFINFCLHYIADLDIPVKRYAHPVLHCCVMYFCVSVM